MTHAKQPFRKNPKRKEVRAKALASFLSYGKSVSEFKYRDAVCRKRILDVVRLTVALAGLCLIDRGLGDRSAVAVHAAGCQNAGVLLSLGYTDTVVRTVNRREVDDKQQVVALGRGEADEAEDTAVAVVGVNPLESVPRIVHRVERRILLVHLSSSATNSDSA